MNGFIDNNIEDDPLDADVIECPMVVALNIPIVREKTITKEVTLVRRPKCKDYRNFDAQEPKFCDSLKVAAAISDVPEAILKQMDTSDMMRFVGVVNRFLSGMA